MTAEPIATAKIRIRPEFLGFKQETETEVKQATDAASGKVRIGADTADATVKIDALKARLAEMRDRVSTARVTLDGDDRAQQRLTDLDIRLRRVGLVTSRPKVNLEGVERANLQLDALEAKLATIGGAGRGGGRLASSAGGGFFKDLPNPSGMMLGLGAALPLAGPLAGVLAGGAASLLTPTIAGGLGLGAFGLGAKSSIQQVQKDVQQLTKLTQQYNAAATDKQRAAVLAKEAALWKSLDPAQRAAVKNVDALQGSWKRYQKALEPETFTLLGEGAKIANTALKDLTPVAKGVGDVLDAVSKQAEHALKAPFWHDFFGVFLTEEAPRAVYTLTQVLGNVTHGLAQLAEDFAPLGHDLETSLINLSARFESWTSGQGPGKFVAWVEKEGPVVGHALSGIAQALVGVGKGLTPIGEVELKALTPVLEFIGKLGDEHPAVITALGTALLGIGAGLKVINAAKGAEGVLRVLSGGRLGGGGLGGGLSKAAPVPVYVTNWAEIRSGTGGPGGVKSAEKTAAEDAAAKGEQKATQSVGTRVLEKLGLKGAVRTAAVLAGPLTDAYLATAGGDEAPGQANMIKPGAPELTKRLLPLLAQIPNDRGGHNDPLQVHLYSNIDSPSGAKLNIGQAVKVITAEGTPQQIQQLQQLAQQYPQLAQALEGYNDQQKTLNQLLLVNPGLAKNAAAANKQLGDTLSGVGTTIAGTVSAEYAQMKLLGEQLLNGLIAGMQDKTFVAVQQAKITTNRLMGEIQKTGKMNSPSKVTHQYGVWLAEGLILGFTSQQQTMVNKLPAAFQQALSALQTTTQTAISKFQADAQAKQQYQTGLAGQLAAPLSSLTIDNTGVVGALTGQLGSLKTLRGLEKQLIRRHIDPHLLQQVIEAGPTQGSMLAQSLLTGHGSVAQANRLEKQILGYARQTANPVGSALYGPQLAKDSAAIGRAAAALEHLAGHQFGLSPQAMHQFATILAREIQRVLPTVDKRVVDQALGIGVIGKAY